MPQVQVNNQTVKQFEAAYRLAVAAGDAARASFWPTLSLGLSASRSASNTSTLSGVDNTTTTSRSSVKKQLQPIAGCQLGAGYLGQGTPFGRSAGRGHPGQRSRSGRRFAQCPGHAGAGLFCLAGAG